MKYLEAYLSAYAAGPGNKLRRFAAGGDGGMRSYSACAHGHVDDTTAHRNHIHIGLNWRGAKKKSSFWRYPAG